MDLFSTLITHTNKGLDHAQHMEIKGLDLAIRHSRRVSPLLCSLYLTSATYAQGHN